VVPFKLYLYAAIAAVILSCAGYHYWKVSSLESELEKTKSTLAAMTIANDIQTAEVTRLETLGKMVSDNLKEAQKKNEKMASDFAALKDKFGRVVPKTCEGQMEYLITNVKETNTLWKN
jgi:hypothetical protein